MKSEENEDLVAIRSDMDYSRKFQTLRPVLVDRSGQRYLDFLKTLKPSYVRVWADIALGYAALLATALATAIAPRYGCPPWIATLGGALAIGFWVAYLQLFIHEGAHFNLAQRRETSDLLCDLLIAWMVGTSVQSYRPFHFQHHRVLGQKDDSEMSYFFPLNLLFIFKSLFGLRSIEVLSKRRASAGKARTTRETFLLLIGLSIHGTIVGASFWFGFYALGFAWILGIGMIFPFLGALRQLLEHRDPNADPHIDYFEQDHGAYTRVFGPSVFSSLFGAAGFDRHLLHHWEPQVSYTNLHQLEAYLLDTDIAPIIEMRRSSYITTFLGLLRADVIVTRNKTQ
ncbi:fatty acid desaturase [Bradyrhizobium japonicum USDA 38]|uniref:fatty acid desaturase n=1 Tax=Bradyrhizobium japonicum TaxID=375 RepID=UPI00040E6E85|nr:fatty acid desaturase [Bradyrhizobium japonicum]MCS3894580.1 fatty acid desaturase [Bradyrhizobium japonicum USDA 38]MCS3947094.1 fatty acid desaturase [Bradyrhizobium japonicum]MCW2220075.1 fatty acid desaturase [Bradyrhizobium japonicum]MCW2344689.1 fatty acid desaturase [Bradyrhizobium japonicum]